QARGKDTDSRSDIWAFGCVLYEMLVGRKPFEAETTTDMFAKIVTAQPDFRLLPVATPRSVRLFIEATLNKDPQERLQHVGDMRLFLNERFFSQATDSAVIDPKQRESVSRKKLIASVALVVFVALIAATLYFRSLPETTPPQMLFDLVLPNIVGVPV